MWRVERRRDRLSVKHFICLLIKIQFRAKRSRQSRSSQHSRDRSRVGGSREMLKSLWVRRGLARRLRHTIVRSHGLNWKTFKIADESRFQIRHTKRRWAKNPRPDRDNDFNQIVIKLIIESTARRFFFGSDDECRARIVVGDYFIEFRARINRHGQRRTRSQITLKVGETWLSCERLLSCSQLRHLATIAPIFADFFIVNFPSLTPMR